MNDGVKQTLGDALVLEGDEVMPLLKRWITAR